VRSPLLIAFQALLAAAPALASEAPTIRVTKGSAISIDGRLSEAEWSKATTVGGSGVKLSLLATEGLLQVGLRSEPLFVATLCIAQGDRVHVFHASSALGHAIYQRGEDGTGWTLSQSFEWRLRMKDIASDVEAARSSHRSEHGWVANTVEMNKPEAAMEFQIDASFLSDSPARIAIGLLLRGESPSVNGWPPGPDEDGCTSREVIAGPLPESASFDTSGWASIELSR
jgi:hypothetical protein